MNMESAPITPSNNSSQQAPVATSVEQPTRTEVTPLPGSKLTTPPTTMPKRNKKKSILKKVLITALLLFLFFVVVTGVIGFHTYTVAMEMKNQADQLQLTGTSIADNLKTQNLPAVQTQLGEAKQQLATIKAEYAKLGYYRYIPFANTYYQDGEYLFTTADSALAAVEKTLTAVTPYADVLGFAGEGTFTGGTAEDRVKLMLQTLQAIEPQLDGIASDLQAADAALAQVNADRYPESIQGVAIKSRLTSLQSMIAGANEALNQYRPILLRLPSIAGASEEGRRKYLVLFQNDNELRPTGGFLTAYAIINVDNGKVEAEKSDDIYELDQKFKKTQPIPPKLGKYLTTESKWNLRDMNISPDFRVSMDTFAESYKTVKGEPQDIDGIIAVDTKILTDLLTILGPVNVPGYGTFSAETSPACDCPQIIYALSEIITRPVNYIKEDRKGILGPLMREILTKTYNANKTQLPQIIETGFGNLQGRHIQLYFYDEQDQQAAELINAAGRMTPPPANQDFLAIVNANLAGAKSNLFITYDVLQEIKRPENGVIEKTVAITYKNPRAGDNCNLEDGLLCLNSTNNDWTRLFVPIGSQLISAQGFKNDVETYEENGFTVFDGFHTLSPKSTTKLVVTYTVPYTDEKTYNLYQWKQGGVESVEMIVDVNGDQQQLTIDKDTKVTAPF